MIDLVIYFPCDVFRVLSLSILSVFLFDLICDDVSPSTRKTYGKWCVLTVLCFAGLICAGCFVLVLDDLVKGVPKVCYGFVLCRHREDLFDLAV